MTEQLRDFLDKQRFNKSELLDEEYIAEKISHFADYGGIYYTPKKCLELAKIYINEKV